MSKIIHRLHASTKEELKVLGGWAHDADFDEADVEFDLQRRLAIVPFAQEPPRVPEGPQPEYIRDGTFGEVFKVPFIRYRLLVRDATACEVTDRGRGDPGMLAGMGFDAGAGVLRVYAEIGPDVVISVDRLDADLEVTDEVVYFTKRVGGFQRRWKDSDAYAQATPDLVRPLAWLVRRLRL